MTTPTLTGTPRTAVDWTRKYALAAGIFYLVTFAASIPAAFYFIAPVLDDPSYVLGTGADNRVVVGCLLDAVNAFACIGTAVAVFPVVRRQNESLALGFVASRLVEATVIMVGVVSLLAVVTLRQDVAGTPGADQGALVTTGRALVAVRDWTFLFGPNVCAALNAILFGTLLYRSGLVPRLIPAIGLVGAPLLLAVSVASMFGLAEQGSGWFVIGALPVAAWELSVGIYMTVKGFRPTRLTVTPA
jgi:Domain of unknown function (DUF4386)